MIIMVVIYDRIRFRSAHTVTEYNFAIEALESTWRCRDENLMNWNKHTNVLFTRFKNFNHKFVVSV